MSNLMIFTPHRLQINEFKEYEMGGTHSTCEDSRNAYRALFKNT